ncbi:hypothetical protein L4C37_13220 [Vibrio kagoshimensis]|uniref:hypothetical protein n=1 Tax=Vibrio kagoshimensis TaxID=2910244 RepID=UPI003D1A4E5E
MKINKTLWLTIGLIPFIYGCGNLSSVHRTIEVDKGEGALIDIKQRGVFASNRTFKTTVNGVTEENSWTVVCAEPSPDSMSAYASENSLSIPQKIKLATAFQEGATYTGLRTQSIQLLRDGMYRLCEAHMSGAIDKSTYAVLVRRYQKNMVALLAIEQLTGVVKAPGATVSTNGVASVARDLDEMLLISEENDNAIEQLEASIKSETDEVKKTKATEDLAKLKNKKALYDESIKNSKSIVASGQANASIVTTNNSANSAITTEVSLAVKEIVTEILNADDYSAMCLGVVLDKNYDDEIKKHCSNLLAKITEVKIAHLDAKIALQNKIKAEAIKSKGISDDLPDLIELNEKVGGDIVKAVSF